ncbi:hypothetical protein V8E55_005999 [Tylopilus felleus]
MGSVSTELPPMGKISLIGIWVETVLYGVNCVMYGLCMFSLLRGGKTATPRWVLIVTSTILFLLGTVHVGGSLYQLLDAFVYAPTDVPDYSTIYWLDSTTTLRVLKDFVYDTLMLAQYFTLTWRLYVVFMCDWRVIIFPLLLVVGGVCSIYAASVIYALPNGGWYGLTITQRLIASTWVFGFVHNVSVTGAIVTRLWWMGRTMASLARTSTNRFSSSVYIVIESGAISATCDVFVLTLFATHNSASFSCLDVVAQLAVLAQLLIVVQVWKRGGYRTSQVDSSKTTLDQIRFRTVVSQEQDSSQDLAPDTTLASSPSAVPI